MLHCLCFAVCLPGTIARKKPQSRTVERSSSSSSTSSSSDSSQSNSRQNAARGLPQNAPSGSRGEPLDPPRFPGNATRGVPEGADAAPGALVECEGCGRSFNPKALEVHSRICAKIFQVTTQSFSGTFHSLRPVQRLLTRSLAGWNWQEDFVCSEKTQSRTKLHAADDTTADLSMKAAVEQRRFVPFQPRCMLHKCTRCV